MTKSTVDALMAEKVGKRINLALDGIPQIPKGHGRIAAAAQLFGETGHAVRLWLGSGKAGLPDIKKIPSIAKILDVKIEWLLTGDGAMRNITADQSSINKVASGDVMRFIHNELASLGFYDLAFHKQDTIFGLIYETIKDKPDGISKEFKEFIVTTLNAMK